MRMKNAIISLSILAIFTLCVPNVVVASESNPTTALHSKIVTDTKAYQLTTLTFTAPAQAKVNEWFNYGGSLTAGGKGVGGALIHVQYVWNGRWTTFSNFTTDSDGSWIRKIEPYTTGDYHFRAIYDGDDLYAPSVSNEVVVIVS
ncbi:MAG: hypothetical protein WCE81_03805 [Halobacteriota archaeon]